MKAWEVYGQSIHWKSLKGEALTRARYRCQCEGEAADTRCINTIHLEMHHDRYPLCPGEDNLENVRILCRCCHETFHEVYPANDCGSMVSRMEIAYRIQMVSIVCEHPIGISEDDLQVLIDNLTNRKKEC